MNKKTVSSIFFFKLSVLIILLGTWIYCIFSGISFGKEYWSVFSFCLSQFFMEALPGFNTIVYEGQISKIFKGIFSLIIVLVVCLTVVLHVKVTNGEDVLWGIVGLATGFLFGTPGMDKQ